MSPKVVFGVAALVLFLYLLSTLPIGLVVYLFPVFLVLAFYGYRQNLRDRKSHALQGKPSDAPRAIPSSLHPAIDPAKCMGCAACVEACPEKGIIGIDKQEAVLVAPSKCIGHGACQQACPFDAISLVFGTEKRGVDIPALKSNFETNIPGIFIAGELGGMGLIRNAIEQGRQAMEAVIALLKTKAKQEGVCDVVIAGAGPAGFSASLLAMEKGLDYKTFEQETLGGTVAHYPRGKIVMTHPAFLPTVGKTYFKETAKEDLLKFWQGVEKKSRVKINYMECLETVKREGDYFAVKTQKGVYKTQAVLLTIGRRGTPRKIFVPGEEKTKVVYRLVDQAQYQGQQVLIVGCGDSALETSLSLLAVSGATVTLCCQEANLGNVKQENLEKVKSAQEEGRLCVYFCSCVEEIRDEEVVLVHDGQRISIKNDAVIVCLGGMLPINLLKEMGVQVETKYGTA